MTELFFVQFMDFLDIIKIKMASHTVRPDQFFLNNKILNLRYCAIFFFQLLLT